MPVSHVNDSYSLKPLFSDEAASSGRTHSFSEISNGTSQRRYALRTRASSWSTTSGSGSCTTSSPIAHETTNLYESAQYAAVRATLQAEIAVLKADAAPGYFQ